MPPRRSMKKAGWQCGETQKEKKGGRLGNCMACSFVGLLCELTQIEMGTEEGNAKERKCVCERNCPDLFVHSFSLSCGALCEVDVSPLSCSSFVNTFCQGCWLVR
mmetsp:Transcript_30797/g.60646  ORF Transcript_30797/g.60646 Transcript_30797/m.60646 type:complete len:105 (-) Transcript_30797:879-1193(-)